MTNNATKTYLVGVIERAIAYYEVEAEDPHAAAENWEEGQFYDRDDEALDTEGPCNVRERQHDGKWRKVPESEWRAADGTEARDDEAVYDYYEISGCRRYAEYVPAEGYEGMTTQQICLERCADGEAELWTLYGHIPRQGLEAIGEFPCREAAERVYYRITGRRYSRPSRINNPAEKG
jgi:hypothetical protein